MSIDSLGALAAEIAMRSAARYIQVHRVDVDLDELTSELRRTTRAALDEALRDAKEASDIGMNDAAVVTFSASMTQAGITAVQNLVP